MLTEEDEAFLQRVTSNPDNGNSSAEQPKPVGKDAQIALMDGAQDIPLPMSPLEEEKNLEKELSEGKVESEERKVGAESSTAGTKKHNRRWSLWLRKGSTDVNTKKVFNIIHLLYCYKRH